MSEFGTNDASHELIPLYIYALTLPTNHNRSKSEVNQKLIHIYKSSEEKKNQREISLNIYNPSANPNGRLGPKLFLSLCSVKDL